MFGGDEVSAIVIDAGSTNTRGGYAGEDSPKCVFQTAVGTLYTVGDDNTVGQGQKAVGENEDVEMTDAAKAPEQNKIQYFVGTTSLAYRRETMEVEYPIQNGLVTNWDQMERIYDHALRDRLKIDPAEHPLLLTESSFNTKELREKLAELLFEKYDTPALFIAKDAVLTCFASGKSSGLVLDSGGGLTRVTPVHDGYALQKAIVKSRLGGEYLTDEYRQVLEKKGVVVRPHYLIQSKKEIRPNEFEVVLKESANATESYRLYSVRNIVRDVKESIFRVSDFAFDEDANSNIPNIPYELPDGNTVDVGTDRFKFPEYLFNPDNSKFESPLPADELLSLPQMITNSVAKCDADIRREMFNSIIVTGGNTLFPQFPERLNKDLLEKQPPQMYKVKIIASAVAAERKYSSWIGGSILGSLGTFQQLWASRQEWEEFGRAIIDKKCP